MDRRDSSSKPSPEWRNDAEEVRHSRNRFGVIGSELDGEEDHDRDIDDLGGRFWRGSNIDWAAAAAEAARPPSKHQSTIDAIREQERERGGRGGGASGRHHQGGGLGRGGDGNSSSRGWEPSAKAVEKFLSGIQEEDDVLETVESLDVLDHEGDGEGQKTKKLVINLDGGGGDGGAPSPPPVLPEIIVARPGGGGAAEKTYSPSSRKQPSTGGSFEPPPPADGVDMEMKPPPTSSSSSASGLKTGTSTSTTPKLGLKRISTTPRGSGAARDVNPTPGLGVTSPVLDSSSNPLNNDVNASSQPSPSSSHSSSPSSSSTSSAAGSSSGAAAAAAAVDARNRWRRVKHTIQFAQHMSQSAKENSGDFLQHSGPSDEHLRPDQQQSAEGGRAGAAAFEGAKLKGRFRAKGRQGMEGMLVRQDKGIITLLQDLYVACLKMPMSHFLLGVFLAPIALGLLFTPIYLLDRGGLSLDDGVTLAEVGMVVSRVAKAKSRVSALGNVFLYALSLSTTFGGSPVAALSTFCLCVANVNTLMGQFLFVFLSGAVFARMSQPSEPLRCAKKAIIRSDDFTATPSPDPNEKFKVFAIRLVLTGPPPCELVDAKICLTFRIFIKLPSGSMFCSTQDLDLVRSEISYLRYGIMVRHVIDRKSPVYGHTMESLLDGDASFSLTIMGLERASMQPIFHLEDYFVCDGDVAWDADYQDFIHVNNDGHRVLDHSKIDRIRVTEKTKIAPKKGLKEEQKRALDEGKVPGWRARDRDKSKAMHNKSTSFTRADW